MIRCATLVKIQGVVDLLSLCHLRVLRVFVVAFAEGYSTTETT